MISWVYLDDAEILAETAKAVLVVFWVPYQFWVPRAVLHPSSINSRYDTGRLIVKQSWAEFNGVSGLDFDLLEEPSESEGSSE